VAEPARTLSFGALKRATLYVRLTSGYYYPGIVPGSCFNEMIVRKTLRILGISLALIALLVFATGVVSDWHHSDSTNDAHCPYCHLGHQVPIQPEAPLWVGVLKPVDALALLNEAVPDAGPVFSQIAPRAPPSA
jgi:hypothetical protein